MAFSRQAVASDIATFTNNWVPVFTSAGGTLTVQPTVNIAQYMQIGAWFFGQLDCTVVSLGSGSPTGALITTLPVTPSHRGIFNGFEQALTGSLAIGKFANATPAANLTFSDGTSLFVAGNRFVSGIIAFKV